MPHELSVLAEAIYWRSGFIYASYISIFKVNCDSTTAYYGRRVETRKLNIKLFSITFGVADKFVPVVCPFLRRI